VEYCLSFSKRMLVVLACAQILLLAACFGLGMMAGRQAGVTARLVPGHAAVPAAPTPASLKERKGE